MSSSIACVVGIVGTFFQMAFGAMCRYFVGTLIKVRFKSNTVPILGYGEFSESNQALRFDFWRSRVGTLKHLQTHFARVRARTRESKLGFGGYKYLLPTTLPYRTEVTGCSVGGMGVGGMGAAE